MPDSAPASADIVRGEAPPCEHPVQIERLWHGLCRTESFSLFGAYPKLGFTRDVASAIDAIGAAHSKLVRE